MVWGLVVLAVVVVAAVCWGVTANRRRIAELEDRLEALSEAERIVARAQARRDRTHLKLLGFIPLGWLAGRLTSAPARLAAVTAASATLTGASMLAPESNTSRPHTPPAAAEITPTPPPAEGGETFDYPYSASTTTVTTSAAALPPAATADQVAVPAPSPTQSAVASAPSTTTTNSTTTTTTTMAPEVTVDLPRACVNPVPAVLHLCQVG